MPSQAVGRARRQPNSRRWGGCCHNRGSIARKLPPLQFAFSPACGKEENEGIPFTVFVVVRPFDLLLAFPPFGLGESTTARSSPSGAVASRPAVFRNFTSRTPDRDSTSSAPDPTIGLHPQWARESPLRSRGWASSRLCRSTGRRRRFGGPSQRHLRHFRAGRWAAERSRGGPTLCRGQSRILRRMRASRLGRGDEWRQRETVRCPAVPSGRGQVPTDVRGYATQHGEAPGTMDVWLVAVG